MALTSEPVSTRKCVCVCESLTKKRQLGFGPVALAQQKQPKRTDTVSVRLIRDNGTRTVTLSSKRTVAVYSVMGPTQTDFTNGTVLYTVEVRITDRPSPSVHRLSCTDPVKTPSELLTRSRQNTVGSVNTDSVVLSYYLGCPTSPERSNLTWHEIKIEIAKVQ